MAQTMDSGVTHERCADFRHGKKKKKQKRGEFITPPRPTGRRSNNMSPERVESKRESMRNVEKFLYVNTIAAGNLNKIVANKLLVLLLSASPYFHMYNYITQ